MKRARSARPPRREPAQRAAMKQLVLDIHLEAPSSFAAFVAGANAELVSRLRAVAAPHAFDAVYVWGAPGSGRSHLLRATQGEAQALGRPAIRVDGCALGDDLALAPGALLIVDDCERLGAAGQITLFRAINTARLIGLALLVCGAAPPAQLKLREDLRSRLGSMLIYEVKPLSDEDKAQTLARHAAARGMRVEPESIAYLLRHGSRDLPSLLAVLDALDRASLERKRHITLPLLRRVLAEVSGFGSRVSS